MPRSDLSRFAPDAARVGENIARTIRVIAKLLFDWSTVERDRVESRRQQERGHTLEGSRPLARELPPLTAIYFDELAMSFSRTWDELNKRRKVRYRAAFLTRRGFHGPGRAMNINRSAEEERRMGKRPGDHRRSRFAFTTEVVEKLKPSLGNARVLFRLEGEPWDSSCEVHPQLDPSLWDSWVSSSDGADPESAFLTTTEARYVEAFSSALAGLSKEELRALGTHSSASATCKDIDFNLGKWKDNFADVVRFLKGDAIPNSDADIAAYRLVTTTREVLNKSQENREDYDKARKNVFSSLRTCPDLRDAFEAVQQETAGEVDPKNWTTG